MNVPISIHGKPGSLVITSHPDDEMNEIWDGIVTQLQVGSAIAVALFLMTMMVVSRALAPLQSLSQAMTNIEAGGYDTRVEPGGSPELAAICAKLNHLAATLGDAVEEKRRLAETRRLAAGCGTQGNCPRAARRIRTLSFRAAGACQLADADRGRRANRTPRPCESTAAPCWNRSTPCSNSTGGCLKGCGRLDWRNLGLREAIGALLRLWSESHPGVVDRDGDLAIARRDRRDRGTDHLPHHSGGPDQRVPARPRDARRDHGRAGAVRQAGTARGDTEAITVSVRDNGAGLPPDHKQGFGMIGMRERVLALGGTMTVASTRPGRHRGSAGSVRHIKLQAVAADLSHLRIRRRRCPTLTGDILRHYLDAARRQLAVTGGIRAMPIATGKGHTMISRRTLRCFVGGRGACLPPYCRSRRNPGTSA